MRCTTYLDFKVLVPLRLLFSRLSSASSTSGLSMRFSYCISTSPFCALLLRFVDLTGSRRGRHVVHTPSDHFLTDHKISDKPIPFWTILVGLNPANPSVVALPSHNNCRPLSSKANLRILKNSATRDSAPNKSTLNLTTASMYMLHLIGSWL